MSETSKRRSSPRLESYDYSKQGAYFLTICTYQHQGLFGNVRDGNMHLNPAGEMVESTWLELDEFYSFVQLDAYIIMPNHVHGIILLQESDTVGVSDIMQRFKSKTTHLYGLGVRQTQWLPYHERLWQRSFYDHIIRQAESLDRIREYIYHNPLKWDLEKNSPENYEF